VEITDNVVSQTTNFNPLYIVVVLPAYTSFYIHVKCFVANVYKYVSILETVHIASKNKRYKLQFEQFLQTECSSCHLINSCKVSANAEGPARRATSHPNKTNRPSRCTQRWTLSVINRRRSSVDCWQNLTTFTATKCCQQHTDDGRLFMTCAVAKCATSRIWDKVPEGSKPTLNFADTRIIWRSRVVRNIVHQSLVQSYTHR